MPRVLVAGRIHEKGISILRNARGINIDYVHEVSVEAYEPYLGDADAILIRTQPLTATAIDKAPQLKIVSRHGVGYDSVEIGRLNERHIPLAVVGDVHSRAVAEHTMMLILAAARRAALFDRKMRQGDWNYRNSLDSTEIGDKSLLLVGFGRIGQRVSRIASNFDMEISAYDPFVPSSVIVESGARPIDDLDIALGEADVISLHLPKLNDDFVLTAQRISRLKRGAIVVNTARGGMIDEASLLEALDSGRMAAAGLDVFNEEPMLNAKLLACDRIVLSPHTAGLTEECAERMAIASAKNILNFFEGRLDPKLVVNHSQIKIHA